MDSSFENDEVANYQQQIVQQNQ